MRDAVKADTTGACGRAAIHDVKIRRMLDSGWWYSYTAPTPPVPFIIDPLLAANLVANTATLWASGKSYIAGDCVTTAAGAAYVCIRCARYVGRRQRLRLRPIGHPE